MLYKVVLTFEATMKYPSVVIQLKATEQYLPAVLFINKLMNENPPPPRSPDPNLCLYFLPCLHE